MPSDPFVGEIFMAAFNYAPIGCQSCNGSLLSISSYTALFALLGVTFGGNGTTNFGIPNLQGRVPIGMGTGSGLSSRTLGEMAGTESVTLAFSEMPAHTHTVNANTSAGTTSSPQGALWANTGALDKEYTTSTANATMSTQALSAAGGSQPHSNMQPYIVLNFYIATAGTYPSRP